MSLLSESTKKEISKKFELPERQSKIATMIKQTDDVYCICRSTDSTSFMICCDSCEEWYHGHCIGISKQESKHIKHYYCLLCTDSNPSLKIEYRKKKESTSTTSAPKEKLLPPKSDHVVKTKITPKSETKRGRPPAQASINKRRGSNEVIKTKSGRKCGNCAGCLRKEDCGNCDVCVSYALVGTRNRQLCNRRQCLAVSSHGEAAPNVLRSRNLSTSSSEDDHWSTGRGKKAKVPASKRSKKSVLKKVTSRRGKKAYVYESDTTDLDTSSEDDIYVMKQCKGPGCVYEARPRSNYCSDDCGIKLASQRMYNILPPRLKEYTLTPCVADIRNDKEIDDIQQKLIVARRELDKYEQLRKNLDVHIAKVEGMKVEVGHEDDKPDDEDGTSIHCVTCGHEVPTKACMKHMEKCYRKNENQTSFGSMWKTNVEGTPLFCDSFNPASGTYCKRLAVICPEHSKEVKFGESEICGYRLVDRSLNLTGETCRFSKRRCNTHFHWEKLSRAIFDMERVRLYIKLDELTEQERQLRIAKANRGGIVGLLLNSAFDHDESERRMKMQMEEEAKVREEIIRQEKARENARNQEAKSFEEVRKRHEPQQSENKRRKQQIQSKKEEIVWCD